MGHHGDGEALDVEDSRVTQVLDPDPPRRDADLLERVLHALGRRRFGALRVRKPRRVEDCHRSRLRRRHSRRSSGTDFRPVSQRQAEDLQMRQVGQPDRRHDPVGRNRRALHPESNRRAVAETTDSRSGRAAGDAGTGDGRSRACDARSARSGEGRCKGDLFREGHLPVPGREADRPASPGAVGEGELDPAVVDGPCRGRCRHVVSGAERQQDVEGVLRAHGDRLAAKGHHVLRAAHGSRTQEDDLAVARGEHLELLPGRENLVREGRAGAVEVAFTRGPARREPVGVEPREEVEVRVRRRGGLGRDEQAVGGEERVQAGRASRAPERGHALAVHRPGVERFGLLASPLRPVYERTSGSS